MWWRVCFRTHVKNHLSQQNFEGENKGNLENFTIISKWPLLEPKMLKVHLKILGGAPTLFCQLNFCWVHKKNKNNYTQEKEFLKSIMF